MKITILKTVLIIDDNKINRQILNKILEQHYKTVEAENGQVGLDLLFQNPVGYSAILLDLSMPVMDGYTFLQHVQENSKLKNIPIIVTTSHSETDREIKSLEMGAWDFVSKPYNPDIILFRLKNAISRSQLETLKEILQQSKQNSIPSSSACSTSSRLAGSSSIERLYTI